MIPRPPKSPTRTEVPAEKCPTITASSAASFAPNKLAAVRESMRENRKVAHCDRCSPESR
eukprot:4765011-Pyramimonas_sp.AAC.1